jgi:hypothetical protein
VKQPSPRYVSGSMSKRSYDVRDHHRIYSKMKLDDGERTTHPLIAHVRDVVIDGAPINNSIMQDDWECDFFDLLHAFKILEQAGDLTLTDVHWHRIENLLHANLVRRRTNVNNVLMDIMHERLQRTWRKAWVVEFLITKCNACVERERSYSFLSALFEKDTPADVLAVCDRHWDLLKSRGLDVNGAYNHGYWHALAANSMNPNYIEKAIARGANPFGMHHDGSISLLEYMRREVGRTSAEYIRNKIRHSMRIVQDAQNGHY